MRRTQKKTVAKDSGREVNALRSRQSVLPLDYMLKVMNDDRVSRRRRDAMAEAALPFLHQKLPPLAIDHLGTSEEHHLDLSKLTVDELKQLEQIQVKAK